MAHKVKPGDEFKIPAATWNRHDDAAEYVHRNLMLGRGDTAAPRIDDSNRLTVKNASGAARRRGEILEFNDFALNADFEDREVWLIGGAVAMANGFCVLQDPVPDGEFTEYGQVFGKSFALVNVIASTHKYASPKKDSYVLQSCPAGPVRILYKPSGTGEKTCAVFITQDPTGLVKPVATITKGSPGDCKVWLNGADTGATVNLIAILGDCEGGLYATQWGGYVFPGECP